jgi:hypothetical protein
MYYSCPCGVLPEEGPAAACSMTEVPIPPQLLLNVGGPSRLYHLVGWGLRIGLPILPNLNPSRHWLPIPHPIASGFYICAFFLSRIALFLSHTTLLLSYNNLHLLCGATLNFQVLYENQCLLYSIAMPLMKLQKRMFFFTAFTKLSIY